MLQNRIGMKVSPFRIFKNYKYVFKSNITKSYFFEKNFILFYYYDIMSFQQQGIIQKKLLDNGLKYYKLKKKLLKNFIFENNLNYFQNLFENNVLIVYNFKDEDLIFNYTIFTKDLCFKELHFIGIWLYNQFLRPWELKKYFTISPNIYKKNIIQILKYTLMFNFNILIKKKN